MATAEPVTVAVINYNGGPVLAETVDSLSRLTYPDFSLMIVDNGSTDDSLALASSKHPEARIIRLPSNGGPSAARNAALRESTTSLVFLSDNDITAAPDMLSILVEEMRKLPKAALCSPRVLYSDRTTILSDGVSLHYLAMSIPIHRQMSVSEVTGTEPTIQVCASGGMMLVDKSKIDPSDYFDEDYFFGWDDAEFSYRVTLAGSLAVTAPRAVVVHREKVWGLKRSFHQIRNRWYLMLITYSGRTLLLIAPILAAYELLMAVFMLTKGQPGTYLRGMGGVLGHLRMIRIKRRHVQSKRVRKDSDLLRSGDIYIRKGLIRKPWLMAMARLVNRIFDLYWKLVKPLV